MTGAAKPDGVRHKGESECLVSRREEGSNKSELSDKEAVSMWWVGFWWYKW